MYMYIQYRLAKNTYKNISFIITQAHQLSVQNVETVIISEKLNN